MIGVKDWPEYSGVLQEPIEYPHLTIFKHRGDKERLLSEFRKHIAKTRNGKIDALFALYDIDPRSPESWHKLAFALASRHVPGFQMEALPDFDKPRARLPRRPGRPSHKGNPERLKAEKWLKNQYAQIKSRNPLASSSSVCSIIRKRKDLPEILRRRNSPLSAKRLYEIIRSQEKSRESPVVEAILKRVSEGAWPA
jgi:hypothetical protein